MKIDNEQIRAYRLRSHHLDRLYPADHILEAAGACGIQNTPPGAWEISLLNRLENCSLHLLHDTLYRKKQLLQAWSYRGAPVVFPANRSDVFLSALIARQGEHPWIYTRGIASALDFMHMSFDDLLIMVEEAAAYLDTHTVKSKDALDKLLAGIVYERLPEGKQRLWNAPSMYGNPEKQIVGEAIVSFLLRPCSFESLVVFGERQGNSPTFTSYKHWLGHTHTLKPGADRGLARKFLHCYGPASVDSLAAWLGSSRRQARRIWDSITDEIEPVEVSGKTQYMLSRDLERPADDGNAEPRLILLGAHDPYLDQRDRTVILEDRAKHKEVWKTVANPGAVLRAGRIIGTWKAKTVGDKLDISIDLWESVEPREQRVLETRAEALASFRLLRLRRYLINTE